MARLFYHVMQDNVGNLLFGVSGTMRIGGSGTAATIYGDEALTVILPNPMTNHPSYGSFKCYLGPGSYDFYMAKAGYSFETLTGVQGGGTLGGQDASAVAITGGTAVLADLDVDSPTLVVDIVNHRVGIGVAAPAEKLSVLGTFGVGQAAQFYERLSVNRVPVANVRAALTYDRAADAAALAITPTADTGSGVAVFFANAAGTLAGTITTTGSTTAYNTTSDARLKCEVEPLAGALDVVRALNPITHRWRADDSPGVGFLAHEVQTVAPEAVTGTPDGVDEAGQIVPQGMDYGKLVPYLVSAVKELTQQVEMLQAQLAQAGA